MERFFFVVISIDPLEMFHVSVVFIPLLLSQQQDSKALSSACEGETHWAKFSPEVDRVVLVISVLHVRACVSSDT